jgi:endonuclease-3
MIGDEIITRLRSKYARINRVQSKNAFRTLIRTILSQNTNFRNEDRAFKELDRKIGVNPISLANSKLEDVINSIKSAGLYRNKAPRIIEISKIVSDKYHGDFSHILEKRLADAREELMTLPGVGPKTADVFLLFEGNKAVIPVDTHILRISKRLGIARKKAGYEEVRRALEGVFKIKDYLDAHLLLIQLGREICTARKARCNICPLNDICPKLI